jgi:hypothetical protein
MRALTSIFLRQLHCSSLPNFRGPNDCSMLISRSSFFSSPDSIRRAVPQLRRQCAPTFPFLQLLRLPPRVVTMGVGARYEILCGREPGARARAILPRRRAVAGVRGEGGGVCAWVDMRARAVHTCGLTLIQPDPVSRARCRSRISNARVLAVLAALNDLRLDAGTRRTTSLRAQPPVVVRVWG